MVLVTLGPLAIDLDDVRAIVDRLDQTTGINAFEVIFRDGMRLEFEGVHADALREFLPHLPNRLPVAPREAVMGIIGRPEDPSVPERVER